MNTSFPKRDKQQSKKWVCNANAKFVNRVLDKSSSYILKKLFIQYIYDMIYKFGFGIVNRYFFI